MPTLTTNCSNNYGPFQFPEKLIPLMIHNATRGKSLPVYGDGLNVRDWLYVTDHCEAIRQVLRKGRIGECYNIGGNSEKSNIEVVQEICAVLSELRPGVQYESLITYVKDRPGHDRRYAMDCAKILREHLEDHAENYTRFLLLAPSEEVPDNADKLSLVMHLAHRPGSLCLALNCFARRNLNLMKIESRPIPGKPWSYSFYLDLQASLKEANTREALKELRQFTESVKILGCYPQAKR